MTTTVTVQAHCAENTEVHIFKDSETLGRQSFIILQDGEENTQYVYDDLSITVREVKKEKV